MRSRSGASSLLADILLRYDCWQFMSVPSASLQNAAAFACKKPSALSDVVDAVIFDDCLVFFFSPGTGADTCFLHLRHHPLCETEPPLL